MLLICTIVLLGYNHSPAGLFVWLDPQHRVLSVTQRRGVSSLNSENKTRLLFLWRTESTLKWTLEDMMGGVSSGKGVGVVALGEGVVALGEGVVSAGEGVVSVSVGGVVSTGEGVVSAEGVVSTGEGVVSAGEGVVSTGEGVVSAREGVVSTGEGVVSAEEGVVSVGEDVVGGGVVGKATREHVTKRSS
jgi:hypothetical protein